MKSKSQAKELHPGFLKQVISLMEYISTIGLKFNNNYEKIVHNAMVFFQRLILNNENVYYETNTPTNPNETFFQRTDTLLLSALASYHLSLKVNEFPRDVKKISAIIINIFKTEMSSRSDYRKWKKEQVGKPTDMINHHDYIESILVNEICPILKNFKRNVIRTIFFLNNSNIDQILDKLDNYLCEGIINGENDLIYLIDFNLEVKSPYDYLQPFITHIMHWYLKNDKTVDIRQISLEVDIEARSILRLVLSRDPYFYSAQPQIMALLAIQKAFEVFGIELKSPSIPDKVKWYEFLYPGEDPDEIQRTFDYANSHFFQNDWNDRIFHNFINDSFSFKKRNFKTEVDPKVFNEFLFIPYEKMSPGEPLNIEPPPFKKKPKKNIQERIINLQLILLLLPNKEKIQNLQNQVHQRRNHQEILKLKKNQLKGLFLNQELLFLEPSQAVRFQ